MMFCTKIHVPSLNDLLYIHRCFNLKVVVLFLRHKLAYKKAMLLLLVVGN